MKALLTGGAGFIGSHLCDRLVAQGHDVVIVDDFSLGRWENIGHLSGRIRVIEDSQLNIAAHRDALQGVSRVYHLGALISGQDSLSAPDAYLHANVIGLLRVLEVAGAVPGTRIVFASTSTVYGDHPEPLRSESSAIAPPTIYALSKHAAEHVLGIYRSRYGYSHVSLRLFNVYGPRQNPDHPYANVTCKFSAAAAGDGRVALYGDGEQSRDFVYVDDVVDAFMLVSEESRHAIYNVGSGVSTSINGLLEEVAGAAGRDLDVDARPPWPNDIRSARADISRLAGEFGFVARVPLAEGLGRTIDYFRGAHATSPASPS